MANNVLSSEAEDQGIDLKGHVIGEHAVIATGLRKDQYNSAFRIDYIPPLRKGYAHVNWIWADMPQGASFVTSEFYLDWTWTLTANTSFRDIVTTAGQYEQGSFFDSVNFTIRNSWNALITDVIVYAVLFDKDDRVLTIVEESITNNILPNSTITESSYVFDDISQPDSITTRVIYDFFSSDVSISSFSDDQDDIAFIFPDSSISVVADTVYVNVDTMGLSARIQKLLRGDLNEDGVVNMADFLLFSQMFSENFGK